eukprot:820186-Pyramimonas_sp.AAC.1
MKATLEQGLVLDEYHHRTPKVVIVWMRDFFNTHGGGTGVNVHQILEMTPTVEAEWLDHADSKRIKLNKYAGQVKAWEWISEHATYAKFYKDKDQWEQTKSFMRALRFRKWHTEFLEFLGDECDFTSPDLDKDELLGNLHTAMVIMKKFA